MSMYLSVCLPVCLSGYGKLEATKLSGERREESSPLPTLCLSVSLSYFLSFSLSLTHSLSLSRISEILKRLAITLIDIKDETDCDIFTTNSIGLLNLVFTVRKLFTIVNSLRTGN